MLRVFENRVLRRTFGPKRDEVTGEWRRLHNEELYSLYSSPDIIRVIKSRRLSITCFSLCVLNHACVRTCVCVCVCVRVGEMPKHVGVCICALACSLAY